VAGNQVNTAPSMAVAPLRDRHRERVLADIHAAAFQLISDRGFAAVTTEQIAAAAGVSLRTLYRYVTTKEELLLGAVRHRGAVLLARLDQRPRGEAPDVALAHAITERVSSFNRDDMQMWRQAILNAPGLLDKVSTTPTDDIDRIVVATAARMNTDADDPRPALLVHLMFAAGDFAFRRWVRTAEHDDRRPLDTYVAEALHAVMGQQWKP
jgi:AcrR family transcriptional regulator